MYRKQRVPRERGIALLTTMAAIVLVVMLVAAFLATRRSYLSLSRHSEDQQACRDAVRSLAEFCRFRLEDSQSWGRVYDPESEPLSYRDSDDQVVVSLREVSASEASSKPEFDGLEGFVYFEGTMPRTGVKFQISIFNNLASTIASLDDAVGAKSCRLRLRANLGGSMQSTEVVLRKAAFFDSTIAAGGDIDIDSDGINFSSVDPLRNQIRSKSNILLPEISKIAFTPPNDFRTSEKGTIWAAGDISVDEDSSATKLADAARATGGEFLPKAQSQYSVPKLKKEDLDSKDAKPVRDLDPASYVFNNREVSYLDTGGTPHKRRIPVLEVCTPVESPEEGPPRQDTLEGFHFMEAALDQPPLPGDFVHTPNLSTVVLDMGVGQDPIEGTKETEDNFGVQDGLKFTLPKTTNDADVGAVTFQADVDYHVAGTFKIRSRGSLPPGVSFVDPNPDPDHPKEGSISVERDLEIQGNLSNCGKLLAGRDVELLPKDVKIDKKEEGNDLAVFAGRDVRVRPLFNNNPGFLNDDRRIFSFRGLVYAEGKFEFRSTVDRDETHSAEYHRNLYIEGALIARQGSVLVQGNEKVELKFNPEYLDDLMEKTEDEDHAQLEQLSWKPL